MRILWMLLLLSKMVVVAEETTEETFTKIYDDKVWGENEEGEGTSGSGATLRNSELYRRFLQAFLKKLNIRSVVDIGCGDWQFSKAIDWSGIKYTGYDVVKHLIDENIVNYSTPQINFIHGNAAELDLPVADLLICKDVLQHLPYEDIFLLLSKFQTFKYCLITNDIDPRTLTSNNPEIKRGDYRLLDISKSPFFVKGQRVLIYQSGEVTKMVYLIER